MASLPSTSLPSTSLPMATLPTPHPQLPHLPPSQPRKRGRPRLNKPPPTATQPPLPITQLRVPPPKMPRTTGQPPLSANQSRVPPPAMGQPRAAPPPTAVEVLPYSIPSQPRPNANPSFVVSLLGCQPPQLTDNRNPLIPPQVAPVPPSPNALKLQNRLPPQSTTQSKLTAHVVSKGAVGGISSCPICQKEHSGGQSCVDTNSEISLRIALDTLRTSSGDEEDLRRTRELLTNRLRELRSQNSQNW